MHIWTRVHTKLLCTICAMSVAAHTETTTTVETTAVVSTPPPQQHEACKNDIFPAIQVCHEQEECYCGVSRHQIYLDNEGSTPLACRHPGYWTAEGNLDNWDALESNLQGDDKKELCGPYEQKHTALLGCLSTSKPLYPLHGDIKDINVITNDECAAVVFSGCLVHFDDFGQDNCCKDTHGAMKQWTALQKSTYERRAESMCSAELRSEKWTNEGHTELKKFFKPWDLNEDDFCLRERKKLKESSSSSMSPREASALLFVALVSVILQQ